MEHAAHDAVSELEDALTQIVYRQAERQQPRIFHFKPVVEDRHPDWGATLGIICMHHGVDDSLAHGRGRQIPVFFSTHGANLRAVQGVFLDEGDRLFDGLCRIAPDGRAIGNVGFVGAAKTSGLNPGIGQVALPLLAEKHHPADGRHRTSLVLHEQPQRLQIRSLELAHRCERLGSGSEVEDFRVEIRHRLFVIGFAASEAPQFFGQLPVGATIGGADPHINAAFQPGVLDVMWPSRAGVHL